jgi:hypothetical protein
MPRCGHGAAVGSFSYQRPRSARPRLLLLQRPEMPPPMTFPNRVDQEGRTDIVRGHTRAGELVDPPTVWHTDREPHVLGACHRRFSVVEHQRPRESRDLYAATPYRGPEQRAAGFEQKPDVAQPVVLSSSARDTTLVRFGAVVDDDGPRRRNCTVDQRRANCLRRELMRTAHVHCRPPVPPVRDERRCA